MVPFCFPRAQVLAFRGGFAFDGPKEAAAHEFICWAIRDHIRFVTQCIIVDAAEPPLTGPDDRHIDRAIWRVIPRNLVRMGGGKHVVCGINVQVILLGADVEITDPRNKWIVRCDPDSVLYAIAARMRDPICTRHELPKHIVTKGIAHTAVTSCDAGALRHNFGDFGASFSRKLAHRPNGNDEIIIAEVWIIEAIEAAGNSCCVASAG